MSGTSPFSFLTVGHEIAGVVTKIGDKVTRFKVGDRVGVGCLVYGCGYCEFCKIDREQFWRLMSVSVLITLKILMEQLLKAVIRKVLL